MMSQRLSVNKGTDPQGHGIDTLGERDTKTQLPEDTETERHRDAKEPKHMGAEAKGKTIVSVPNKR